ncbi:hypothetical protein OG21DRAFT_450367 [Imleria badia]|nr:hypothetical protein OG21DRAFT_450367 [Imleria badia]
MGFMSPRWRYQMQRECFYGSPCVPSGWMVGRQRRHGVPINSVVRWALRHEWTRRVTSYAYGRLFACRRAFVIGALFLIPTCAVPANMKRPPQYTVPGSRTVLSLVLRSRFNFQALIFKLLNFSSVLALSHSSLGPRATRNIDAQRPSRT